MQEYRSAYWYVDKLPFVFKKEGITNIFKYEQFYERISELCRYLDYKKDRVEKIMDELYIMNFAGIASISSEQVPTPGIKRQHKGKWYNFNFFFCSPSQKIRRTDENEWIVIHPVFTDGFQLNLDKSFPIC